jgi:hypothetical protein
MRYAWSILVWKHGEQKTSGDTDVYAGVGGGGGMDSSGLINGQMIGSCQQGKKFRGCMKWMENSDFESCL